MIRVLFSKEMNYQEEEFEFEDDITDEQIQRQCREWSKDGVDFWWKREQ